MKLFFYKVKRHFYKAIFMTLTFLGFSSVQSCSKKVVGEEATPVYPSHSDRTEIKCMYGGPESFYRPIDTMKINKIDDSFKEKGES